MLTKLKTLFADARRVKQVEQDKAWLIDQMREIEWRLAMCRSCAADVNAAHAIAFRALDKTGTEPAMTSASRYAVEKNCR